jgi:hypothetical protein
LSHCDTRWYKFFINYPAKIEKMVIVLRFICLCAYAIFLILETEACAIPHSASSFQGRIKKKTFVTWYDLIKKIWLGSSRSSTKIKIIRNHLCISSSANIWTVKRGSSRMKALTKSKFVPVLTRRGVQIAVHPFHRFSQLDTKLDFMTLLRVIHRFLTPQETRIYMSHNRTKCVHASKPKPGLKILQGYSYHFATASAPQRSRFSHCSNNLINLLKHPVYRKPSPITTNHVHW